MKRISEEERLDRVWIAPSKRIQSLSLGLTSIKGVNPIELLKDLEIRREV